MAEQQPQQNALIVHQCTYCSGSLRNDGTIVWQCDAWHPEVLTQMEQMEREQEEGE